MKRYAYLLWALLPLLAAACGDDSEVFYSVSYPVVRVEASVKGPQAETPGEDDTTGGEDDTTGGEGSDGTGTDETGTGVRFPSGLPMGRKPVRTERNRTERERERARIRERIRERRSLSGIPSMTRLPQRSSLRRP